MSKREEIAHIVYSYIDGMNEREIERIPLTADVEYQGSMMGEPVRSEDAVREHLQQIAPFFVMKMLMLVVEGDTAVAKTEIKMVNGVNLVGATFLHVRDGRISKVETLFDTRKLYATKL
jgi:ketosteroid isomerase-like protein